MHTSIYFADVFQPSALVVLLSKPESTVRNAQFAAPLSPLCAPQSEGQYHASPVPGLRNHCAVTKKTQQNEREHGSPGTAQRLGCHLLFRVGTE